MAATLVINEFLTFVQNKVDILDELSIVQICSSNFNEAEIEKGKTELYNAGSSIGSKVKIPLRRGDDKKKKDIKDIIKIFKEIEPTLLPTYVAKDLNRLPPVSFDHVDVTRLLKDINLLKTNIQTIQAESVSKTELAELDTKISTELTGLHATLMKSDLFQNNRKNINNSKLTTTPTRGINRSPPALVPKTIETGLPVVVHTPTYRDIIADASQRPPRRSTIARMPYPPLGENSVNESSLQPVHIDKHNNSTSIIDTQRLEHNHNQHFNSTKTKHKNNNRKARNLRGTLENSTKILVLKGINLSVKRGQSVALVGHSGSGKSTIIQLVSRYYDVIGGSVCIDGRDVRELSVRWLRAQIGVVGQEPVLFNTSVRENIRYGREDATDDDIEHAARQANAHAFIAKLPKGYDTLVGERGASLSGGQKQRIAIARALVRNPKILLLDEATSALDTASEAQVQKALDKAQEGRTTIVVAHRLTTIKNVDIIYVFKNGTVIESGNHEELMNQKGHYYDMVMLQTSPELDNKTDPNKLTREVSRVSEKDNEEEEIFEYLEETKKEDDEETNVPFWKVIRLNAPEWKSITAASVCSLINGFAMPLLGVIIGDFIGALSGPNEAEVLAEVKRFVYIFIGIAVCSGILNFIQVSMYEVAGEYLTERLRRLMFKKVLQQEIGFFDDKNNTTGALCARLSGEAAAVKGATGQRIGTVMQAAGTFGLSLVLSLVYEWRVGLVALAFVPFLAAILYKQGRMVSRESFGTAKTMEASAKIAVEAVANVRTVATLGREQNFLNEYITQLLPAVALAKQSAQWRGIVFGLSRGLFNFIYAAALYYGGILIVYEGIDYATILKSAQVLLMGASSATQAFAFAPNFQKGIKAAGRIMKILQKEPLIKDPKETFENFEGTGQASLLAVKFRYPTRPTVPVLNDLDIEIEKGKTIALVGASGCGKSTVIQLLQRFYDPDEGIVAQDGIPLAKLQLVQVRAAIGFVQQEPVLFDRTIGENIAYGDNSRNPSKDEIINVAKQANIHNFIVSLPMGYDTNIGTKGTQLSGGQKQRIAIARALIRCPKMLLLDEATSALDTESEKVVQQALDAAKAGRTCVMIAHRLSTVRDADVICVLGGGRVAETGTHAELIRRKGLYYGLNKQGYA